MHGLAASRLLGLWLRISPGAWRSVSCGCCVFSGKGLCFGLITCPEESHRVWCVWVWSWSLDNEKALAHWGLSCHENKNIEILTWSWTDISWTQRRGSVNINPVLNGNFRFKIWPFTRLTWQTFGRSSLFLQIHQVTGTKGGPGSSVGIATD